MLHTAYTQPLSDKYIYLAKLFPLSISTLSLCLFHHTVEDMAQIITNIVQGVGGGIGFVSEAYKAHKATKAQKQTDTNAHQPGPYIPAPHHAEDETRDLDETQSDPSSSSETTETEATDPLTLASAFLSRLSPSTPSSFQPLPYPIILPQRRPSDRSRGFLPAYAPILSSCNISESLFLDFLCTFNKSTQATKWIAALNLASLATVCLPTLTSVLVSMAITAATTAAMEVQGRVKTNCFLDKVNEQFFMPRGLFCLVVTWNPEVEDARQAVDFEAMAKRAMGSSGKRNPMSKLKSSSGSTYGEFGWPEIAPLIYPSSGLSSKSSTSEEATQAKKSSLQKKRIFVDDYMDRRAQAKFVSLPHLPSPMPRTNGTRLRQCKTQRALSLQVQKQSSLRASQTQVVRQTAAHQSRCYQAVQSRCPSGKAC